MIVFWATYCPYCKRHNARVDKLHKATQGQASRVLGAALDGDAEAVRRYMAGNGCQFPVTLDDGALRKRFTARRVIPMTSVLDRQGRLLEAIPGEAGDCPCPRRWRSSPKETSNVSKATAAEPATTSAMAPMVRKC